MIRYALKCSNNHDFDSWFASSAAYDTLRTAGMVTCPTCGDGLIEKALMAPRVRTTDTGEERPVALSGPSTDPAAAAIAKLRKEIEKNADDVGQNFVSEARAMHLGDKPSRSIFGQAKPDEARKLVEDGVPILPLPFIPSRKTN
ncbi:DUF1178 family protein [Oceaniglobus ichthyenteri]|uniref:DUF1178 family protein n=1 Tax=Oceaniglobus ichthyenteri TaxID=2136177 RepID=UPI000D339E9E|nr:DUF1178 family protein [Oceaniglobus ichthyenteri]